MCVLGGVDEKNAFKKYWTIRKEISEFIKETITIEFFYGFEQQIAPRLLENAGEYWSLSLSNKSTGMSKSAGHEFTLLISQTWEQQEVFKSFESQSFRELPMRGWILLVLVLHFWNLEDHHS